MRTWCFKPPWVSASGDNGQITCVSRQEPISISGTWCCRKLEQTHCASPRLPSSDTQSGTWVIQTYSLKPLSSVFSGRIVSYLWTFCVSKAASTHCCSSLPVWIISPERRWATAHLLPGPPFRNPNAGAQVFLGRSAFIRCMASAIRTHIFLAGFTCSADRRLLTAKFSLTVIYFLINQNDVRDLKREFIWLLCCVCSDDLYLSQSCARNKPGWINSRNSVSFIKIHT